MRAILSLFLAAGCAHAAKTLDIYFIDVEGGQSTLIVSPSGQSLLIDAGWGNFSGRDADRIADAAKAAHVKRIDYVLITHHHSDHVGGVPNLLERLGVGTFLDHGPTVETDPAQLRPYKAYEEATTNRERKVIKPGDTIPIKGLEITVVEAAGKHIERKGEPNPFCAGIAPAAQESGENPQSAGVVVQFGKFRFADFGDVTWNPELALFCPQNLVGKIDLYLVTHHATTPSSKAIYAMAPRVAITNNGPRKGGDAEAWRVVKASPGLDDIWQLHYALAAGSAANVPDSMIANVEEHCEGKYLKVSAEPSGAFSVFNSRNKYTKTYPAK